MNLNRKSIWRNISKIRRSASTTPSTKTPTTTSSTGELWIKLYYTFYLRFVVDFCETWLRHNWFLLDLSHTRCLIQIRIMITLSLPCVSQRSPFLFLWFATKREIHFLQYLCCVWILQNITCRSTMTERPRDACFVFNNVQLCSKNHKISFLSHPMEAPWAI